MQVLLLLVCFTPLLIFGEIETMFSNMNDENSTDFFSDNNCQIVINELNIIDPSKPERKEFIELKVGIKL